MPKVVKEFMLREETGEVNIEYDDNSTSSFNLANVVTASSSGSGVGIMRVGGQAVGVRPRVPGRRPAFTRVVASSYAGAIAADSACYGHVLALPGRFDAVRIGFVHSGGSGAVAGMTAAVAATDDVGDFSMANTASGRKFATPFRGGVEKNEYSADGWSRVTVGGSNSWGIPDAGSSSQIAIAWSDLIEVHGIADKTYPDMYPLLVRVYGGTGSFTRVGQSGFADPARWLADAGKNYFMGCFRVGAADAVGTLGSWGNGSNVTFTDAACIAMIVEAWSASGVRTITLVGDSRFALPAPSLEATRSYKSAGHYLEKALSGIASVARCARGAQTNATVAGWADQYAAVLQSDFEVYLGYSINTGVPTAALLRQEKTRVLRRLATCAQSGTIPILLPIFPYSNGFGAATADVFEFNEWCKSLGVPYVDLLSLYGDSSGGWVAGWSEDVNHMTDSGYAHLGGVIASAVQALI